MMILMGMPLWAWIVFYVLVFAMLIVDLKMFARKGEQIVEANLKAFDAGVAAGSKK